MSAPWVWDGCRWILSEPVDPPPLPEGPYLPLAGGTMKGPIILASDPGAPMDAVTMQWVQAQIAALKQGVTDGSDVAPGEVGEVLHLVLFDQPFTAATQTQNLTLGTLPPGDWDLMGSMALKTGRLASFNAQVSPLPTGFYSPMNMLMELSSGAMTQMEWASTYTRALTSSASTLIYQVITTGDGVAGTFDISIMGRRMR